MATDTIVRVDPKTLLVGTNVRKDTRMTPEFVASIKENGVRIPITAYEDGDGKLVVVDGQRRTLAAVDAAIADVPVFVSDAPGEHQRIIDQVVVNEQRSDLHVTEAVAAVQELALFDMKAPAIAKKLGLRKDFVDDAVKVGASPAAKKIYEKHHQLSAAVAVAEFEGQPEQAELLALAKDGSIWRVEQAGRELIEKRERAAVTEEIKATEGLTLVEAPGYYSIDPQPLSHMFLDKDMKKSLDDLPHAKVVELAGDGLVGWPDWIHDDGRRRIGVAYGIKGWKDRGLFVPPYYQQSNSSKPSTPEDAEKLKLERRQARLNTKEWVAAAAARIEWLQQLVQRKTMPKGWEVLVARRLVQNDYAPSQLRAITTILQLAADDRHGEKSQILSHLEKNPTKAPQIMLAVWIGAIEGGGDFDKKGWAGTWQVPIEQGRAYLKQLVAWGFELSEIEKAVVAGKVKKTA